MSHRYSIVYSAPIKLFVMKTRRPLTTSEQLAAKRLKAIYVQKKAKLKGEGKSLTYEHVSEFMGITPGAVSQYMNGTTPMNAETCLRFARFFDIPPSNISPDIAHLLPNVTGSDKNVSSLPYNNSAVPLISWVQAGAWQEIESPRAASDAERWILCPVPHSSQTFALRVEGLSMSDPGSSPSFDEGDIIHVDPEVQPENRSLVVVHMNGDAEATFKQLIAEGGEYFLKALNPSWPTRISAMPKDARICGVVVSKTVTYR